MPRRCTIAALVLAAVFASMPAHAQGQAIPPEFRADIERLFAASGTGALGQQMSILVSTQFLDAMKKAQPDVPERAVTIVKETLNAEFATAFAAKGELMTRLADIYAANFTHAEVKALLVFYESEVGRKAVSVLPRLAQEGAAAGQAWAQQNLPRVIRALEQRLRNEQLLK